MKPSFCLCVTHAAHIVDRHAPMQRLRDQIGVTESEGAAGVSKAMHDAGVWSYFEMTDRAANHIWSAAQWWKALERCVSFGASTQLTHALFLQDDVILAPRGLEIIRAMVTAVPDQVIALHCAHQASRTLFREGVRWYTSTDGLIGNGYIFPVSSCRDRLADAGPWETNLLREFLVWRKDRVHQDALPHVTEDTLIDMWGMATGRRFWHPIPTCIDHDIKQRSTYGNDHHTHRRPAVTWEDAAGLDVTIEQMCDPEFWKTTPVHLGRFYNGNHWRLPHILKPTPGLAKRVYEIDADMCPQKYAHVYP